MSFQNLQTQVYNWLVAQTGFDSGHVINDVQSAPRPTRPYAVFHVGGPVVKEGLTDVQVMTGRQRSIQGLRECQVTVEILGVSGGGSTGAPELLSQCRDSLELESVNDAYFTGQGFTVIETSEVQDLTRVSLEETTYQSRAQMTMRVRYAVSANDNVSTIEHVNVTGQVTPEGGSTQVQVKVSGP